MDEHLCPICGKPGASLVAIENGSISVCKECGGIQVIEVGLIFQLDMPLEYDSNYYAVAKAMAVIFWMLEQRQVQL